jgi:hypothetical protein
MVNSIQHIIEEDDVEFIRIGCLVVSYMGRNLYFSLQSDWLRWSHVTD